LLIKFFLFKESDNSNKHPSNWRKVRQALIPSPNKVLRACPSDQELLEQPMFSLELMQKVSNDLNHLNKQIYLTRTFQNLYDQSLSFHTFQSYVQYKNLIQYVYETKQDEQELPNLNDFITYNDLRICQCADYVLTVYIKLVEYHTNLYDIYEKTVDEKRNSILLKQFDRIMYYRTEICQLLLRCYCFQRLLIEIENGRNFLEKFQNDTNNQEDFIFQYQYLILKYTYNFFQATFLQHSRSLYDSKLICEQSLKELNKAYQEKIWEKLISNTDLYDSTSITDKKDQYEPGKTGHSKEPSIDSNCSIPSMAIVSNNLIY
jgi:hypothetical protein